eukprot:EG_transcript_16255
MGDFAEAAAPPPPLPPSPVANWGQPASAVWSPVDVLAGRPPAVEVEADPEVSQNMGMSSGETTPGSTPLQFMAVQLEQVRQENANLRRVKVDLETQVDLLEADVSSLLRMVTEDRRCSAEQTARLEQQQEEVEQLRRARPLAMEVKEVLEAPQAMVTSSGETAHSSAPPQFMAMPARLEQLRQENAVLRRAKAALEVRLATARAAASAGEMQTNQQFLRLLQRKCLRQEERLEQREQELEQQRGENAALRQDKLLLQEELCSLHQQVSWLAAGSQRLHKEAEARDHEVLALRAALARAEANLGSRQSSTEQCSNAVATPSQSLVGGCTPSTSSVSRRLCATTSRRTAVLPDAGETNEETALPPQEAPTPARR